MTAKKSKEKKTPEAAKAAETHKLKTLVIVESPAKARTIEKYLGSRYKSLPPMARLSIFQNRVSRSMLHIISSRNTLPCAEKAEKLKRTNRRGKSARAR